MVNNLKRHCGQAHKELDLEKQYGCNLDEISVFQSISDITNTIDEKEDATDQTYYKTEMRICAMCGIKTTYLPLHLTRHHKLEKNSSEFFSSLRISLEKSREWQTSKKDDGNQIPPQIHDIIDKYEATLILDKERKAKERSYIIRFLKACFDRDHPKLTSGMLSEQIDKVFSHGK